MDRAKEIFVDYVFPAFVILTVLGVVGWYLWYGINYRLKSNLTYEQNVVQGVVIDKQQERVLVSAKPVVYRTVYKTEVEIPSGETIFFDGETVYFACEVGNEILVEIENVYRDEELVRVNYKTVEVEGVNNE